MIGGGGKKSSFELHSGLKPDTANLVPFGQTGRATVYRYSTPRDKNGKKKKDSAKPIDCVSRCVKHCLAQSISGDSWC